MDDTALRARSVSELVDAAFALYRRDASAYIMVTALASVPNLVVQILVLGQANEASAAAVMANLLLMVVSIVSYALMSGVVMVLGSKVYLGGEADVAGSVREVIPRLGALIGAGILRVPLLILGALAFGVGMLYVFARWFALEPAIVLEGKGATESFGRSSQLTDGRKWHVLKTLALGFFIYMLAAFAAGAVGLLFGSELAIIIVSAAFTILAFPVVGLLTMVLYYDARIRAEGFDLQHMAQSMTPAAATP
jgi:hypothetical protein